VVRPTLLSGNAVDDAPDKSVGRTENCHGTTSVYRRVMIPSSNIHLTVCGTESSGSNWAW